MELPAVTDSPLEVVTAETLDTLDADEDAEFTVG